MAHTDELAIQEHAYHVEPVGYSWSPEAVDPDIRRPDELPLLSPRDRLHRIAEPASPACLDLDEGDDAFPLRDEVDVTAPAPEPVGDDAPPLPPKPSRRDPLPELPEPLPGR